MNVRSSHLTFVFLYQLPIFFHRRTLHTIAFHTAQERQRRRVTLSVCAKVESETCSNFRRCSTPTMRSSRRTFVFLYKLPSFIHQHTLHASVLQYSYSYDSEATYKIHNSSLNTTHSARKGYAVKAQCRTTSRWSVSSLETNWFGCSRKLMTDSLPPLTAICYVLLPRHMTRYDVTHPHRPTQPYAGQQIGGPCQVRAAETAFAKFSCWTVTAR